MKKILISLVIACTSVPLFAQQHKKELEKLPVLFIPEALGSVNYKNTDSKYSISCFVSTSFSKKHPVLGVAGLILLENKKGADTWVEGLVGPRVITRNGCVELGILFGGEMMSVYDSATRQNVTPSGFRWSPYLSAQTNNERLFTLLIFEFGQPSATGESNFAFRGETWITVTNPEKNFKLRIGGISHYPHYGPACKFMFKQAYLFCAPYTWSFDKKEPDPVCIGGIGLELNH